MSLPCTKGGNLPTAKQLPEDTRYPDIPEQVGPVRFGRASRLLSPANLFQRSWRCRLWSPL